MTDADMTYFQALKDFHAGISAYVKDVENSIHNDRVVVGTYDSSERVLLGLPTLSSLNDSIKINSDKIAFLKNFLLKFNARMSNTEFVAHPVLDVESTVGLPKEVSNLVHDGEKEHYNFGDYFEIVSDEKKFSIHHAFELAEAFLKNPSFPSYELELISCKKRITEKSFMWVCIFRPV